MKNILVGADFFNGTEEILNKVMELIQIEESKVWLIHVASPDSHFVSYEAGPQTERDDRADNLREKKNLLKKYERILEEKGVETEGLLVQGATAQTLLEKAHELDIDLIVLGDHKHGFLFNAFIGSTSKEVMEKSRIPVLIIPVKSD
jgi:nucleotide-binding universal stress UspA family protein